MTEAGKLYLTYRVNPRIFAEQVDVEVQSIHSASINSQSEGKLF